MVHGKGVTAYLVPHLLSRVGLQVSPMTCIISCAIPVSMPVCFSRVPGRYCGHLVIPWSLPTRVHAFESIGHSILTAHWCAFKVPHCSLRHCPSLWITGAACLNAGNLFVLLKESTPAPQACHLTQTSTIAITFLVISPPFQCRTWILTVARCRVVGRQIRVKY